MDTSYFFKKQVLEPKIYALIVSSEKGQILYMGIHFTLEEAYGAARSKFESFAPHEYGESINIELWNVMTARESIGQFLNPSNVIIKKEGGVESSSEKPLNKALIGNQAGGNIQFLNQDGSVNFDGIKRVFQAKISVLSVENSINKIKEGKNGLIKKLIEDANIGEMERVKKFLSANERKYVISKINKKSKKR